jgi:hypothetical protein
VALNIDPLPTSYVCNDNGAFSFAHAWYFCFDATGGNNTPPAFTTVSPFPGGAMPPGSVAFSVKAIASPRDPSYDEHNGTGRFAMALDMNPVPTCASFVAVNCTAPAVITINPPMISGYPLCLNHLLPAHLTTLFCKSGESASMHLHNSTANLYFSEYESHELTSDDMQHQLIFDANSVNETQCILYGNISCKSEPLSPNCSTSQATGFMTLNNSYVCFESAVFGIVGYMDPDLPKLFCPTTATAAIGIMDTASLPNGGVGASFVTIDANLYYTTVTYDNYAWAKQQLCGAFTPFTSPCQKVFNVTCVSAFNYSLMPLPQYGDAGGDAGVVLISVPGLQPWSMSLSNATDSTATAICKLVDARYSRGALLPNQSSRLLPQTAANAIACSQYACAFSKFIQPLDFGLESVESVPGKAQRAAVICGNSTCPLNAWSIAGSYCGPNGAVFWLAPTSATSWKYTYFDHSVQPWNTTKVTQYPASVDSLTCRWRPFNVSAFGEQFEDMVFNFLNVNTLQAQFFDGRDVISTIYKNCASCPSTPPLGNYYADNFWITFSDTTMALSRGVAAPTTTICMGRPVFVSSVPGPSCSVAIEAVNVSTRLYPCLFEFSGFVYRPAQDEFDLTDISGATDVTVTFLPATPASVTCARSYDQAYCGYSQYDGSRALNMTLRADNTAVIVYSRSSNTTACAAEPYEVLNSTDPSFCTLQFPGLFSFDSCLRQTPLFGQAQIGGAIAVSVDQTVLLVNLLDDSYTLAPCRTCTPQPNTRYCDVEGGQLYLDVDADEDITLHVIGQQDFPTSASDLVGQCGRLLNAKTGTPWRGSYSYALQRPRNITDPGWQLVVGGFSTSMQQCASRTVPADVFCPESAFLDFQVVVLDALNLQLQSLDGSRVLQSLTYDLLDNARVNITRAINFSIPELSVLKGLDGVVYVADRDGATNGYIQFYIEGAGYARFAECPALALWQKLVFALQGVVFASVVIFLVFKRLQPVPQASDEELAAKLGEGGEEMLEKPLLSTPVAVSATQ